MKSQPAPPATSPSTTTRPRMGSPFRKYRSPLSRDDARRQGNISQLAFLTMGGRDPAIAFLNNDHAALGGRPLHIATASDDGYEKVARIIRAAPSEVIRA